MHLIYINDLGKMETLPIPASKQVTTRQAGTVIAFVSNGQRFYFKSDNPENYPLEDIESYNVLAPSPVLIHLQDYIDEGRFLDFTNGQFLDIQNDNVYEFPSEQVDEAPVSDSNDPVYFASQFGGGSHTDQGNNVTASHATRDFPPTIRMDRIDNNNDQVLYSTDNLELGESYRILIDGRQDMFASGDNIFTVTKGDHPNGRQINTLQ
ncbi:hypothetical protein [Aquimarina algicola]|uniref:Uncharacterized protein n=1 Tax=Aquimarina algicola TaxID=2589995 RepID=A0A504JCW2_9FLAO|nr:hypothetical protein [Aquimarina algicola]TPN88836.1 hypothetical protein FHK87_01080 [Aquimarina algicola]